MIQTYKNLIIQAFLAFSVTLLLTFLKIPTFFLRGLHTYVHPENLGRQNGVKAAIRRPSDHSSSAVDGYKSLSSKTDAELKRRNKSKDKFEFDENNAQIFRLKLDQAHLESRVYFNDYWYSFVFSTVALLSLLVYKFFHDVNDGNGILSSGFLIAVILGFVCLFKVILSIAKVSFEKSASRRSEKQISVLLGVLGFVFGFVICSGIAHPVLDFDFGDVNGFGRVFVALLMGCLAGFLFMPASKNARCFWLGTDQVRSNLEIVSCNWFARLILYGNYLWGFFTVLLWINPLAEILVNKNVDYGGGVQSKTGSVGEKLVGNVGFMQSEFNEFRGWCLLLSGIFPIVALRSNLQMYLNEAVLSWYQRLHASKVPDLNFSRAKVFLHNHYLCLSVLQFFVPPILVLLFLGLSQIDGNSFKDFELLCGLLPCTAFTKEVLLFMAWWVVFVWSVLTSAILFLYRRGTLYVS